MIFLRFLLLLVSCSLLVAAVGIVVYDIYLSFELEGLLRRNAPPNDSIPAGEPSGAPPKQIPLAASRTRPAGRRQVRWNMAAKLVLAAALAALFGRSIIVVPDGHAAVRISQLSGVVPGTLYPGTHLIFPLTTRVALYDTRDRIYATQGSENSKDKREVLEVEAREGLSVGLAVTVRYRLDPRRLDYVEGNLPQSVDDQIVAPLVCSVFRQLAPDYPVRDVFSTRREEFRERAAQEITARLGEDGIVVKEVLLRKIDLPAEYAQGLEGLLLKEQEDDQTSVDTDIEIKRVKIAAAQADALKIREVKRAEADAQSRVIMAKADSDSMQYTLPLKQKQIEQSRLEAEARKATTIQDAEAAAQAKVIDSEAEQKRQGLLAQAQADAKVMDAKAEQQRQDLLADSRKVATIRNAEAEAEAKQIGSKAEQESDTRLADTDANRIRVTGKAAAEQLQLQAAALKSNPLLVQYTVAEKLSDKVQIMLVPSDGKYFFTDDVLHSAGIPLPHPVSAGNH
jgi:regulator of protease activity HflC (stomatin/prohibitin superfamily)